MAATDQGRVSFLMAQMPREVRQVRDALKSEFDGLIDMSDVNAPPDHVEQHFLSRALAALVARRVLDCESRAAADTLVDGYRDVGIDAVAVAPTGTRMWLIQSKWSDKGRAGFGQGDARLFREALTYLDNQRFDRFNTKVQDRAELIRSAWGNTRVRVTLVIAIMGDADLHPEVRTRLEDLKEEFNGYTEFLEYQVWSAQDIWQIVRDDNAVPSVDVVAKIDEWMHLAEPFEAYQGRLAVSDVADWYAQHGDRLFAQNIRNSLGLTQVNQQLVETLVTSPADFWYYNNGITVLCESAERHQWNRAARGPIELALSGASVVNGAQTVAAIDEAMRRDHGRAGQAYVGVKVVTTRNTPADFGLLVTKATNTQNHVEPRDFVALDPTQWEIREDFTLTLHKEYVYKRGELDPDPELGCSVTHAALALACANSNSDLAVRAKTNRDALWETGGAGAYDILFHKATPTAARIWRLYQVFRQVQAALAEDKDERGNRADAVATYGDYLITHIVLRLLALGHIDDPDYDWDFEVRRVPNLTAAALNWLIIEVDREFGPTSFIKSTFTNPIRCRALVQHVLSDMATGDAVPELPLDYRPTVERKRRHSTVATLVDAGWIADGTALTFKTRVPRERDAVDSWLAADPKRAQATWVNHRSAPLLWAYDGQRYSPTALVRRIWTLADWASRPTAVRGTAQWYVLGEGSLAQIARAVQDSYDDEPDENSDQVTPSARLAAPGGQTGLSPRGAW
jgi:AIPR protein